MSAATEHFINETDGLAVHHLRSDEIEVRIIPELGAKIAGFLDRRSGREWMWAPEESQLFRNASSDAFENSTLVGADECIPTIAACRWRDCELPDHGEAWSQPWSCETIPGGILTGFAGKTFPFVLSRSAVVKNNLLTLGYSLTNHGDQTEPFIWALHPLMRIQPGDRLEIPANEVVLEVAIGCDLGKSGEILRWPRPTVEVDFSKIELGKNPRTAVKMFARNPSAPRAEIINDRAKNRMRIGFSGDSMDCLGIWINLGGWNGFHHIAIEPTNGSPDALDAAVNESKHHGHIQPGQTLNWQVTMESHCG